MHDVKTKPTRRTSSSRELPRYGRVAGLVVFVVATVAIESLQNHVGPWQMWPLYALWEPSIGPRIVLVLAVVACGWFLHRHVMKVPRAAFLVIILAFSCVFAVAVAIEGQGVKADAKCCVAGGPAAQITAPFRDSDSYFANVPLVDRLGPRRFDQSYPQLDQPPYASLTIHALTHPPGAPLLLWASDEIVGESLLGVCLLMIFLGALSSIATYLIALEIYGERAARLAGLLFCVAPAIVLYLATSMDAVFMTIFAFDFAALVRAPRSNRWALVAGLLWAVALMFTFSAAAIAIVSVGIGLLSLRTRTLRDLAPRAVLVVAGLVGGLAILQVGLGIDTPAVWTATSAAHATLASTYRPYVYWVWANLIAFALVAGIPQTALVLSEVSSRWRAHSPGLETVTLATLIVLTVSNVFKGEVDHIWLFMMPLVLAVAGNRLHALTQDEGMGSLEVRRALGVSVLQTVAMQVLLFTYW